MKVNGITLIGMPTVGKSTVGKYVAKMLNWRFIDLDKQVQQKANKTIRQILDEDGPETLLSLETSCASELDLHNTILATGGSVVYSSEALPVLRASSLIVWLDAPLSVVSTRLGQDPSRGVVGLKQKGLPALYAERTKLYRDWADKTVHVQNKSRQQVAEQIIAVCSLV